MRIAAASVVAVLVLAACGSPAAGVEHIPELPQVDTDDVRGMISEAGVPVVLNVWASWCIPCRSEAPLLDAASSRFDGTVEFIGLNVRDSQQGARSFIAEFFPEAPIDHVFDRQGNVPIDLGATRAVPLTMFFTPDGELNRIHTGVIDERTLALEIDEISR